MSHRPSKYLVYGASDPHVYPIENSFHYNPRVESVWTEEERAVLQHHLATTRASIAENKWESAHYAVPTHSEIECYMQHTNVDDPSINNAEWTSEEDRQLLELVEKYAEHEWSHIAEELGTNRTPIACLRHYQQSLNTKLLNNNEWSSEEDLLLKQAVELLQAAVAPGQMVDLFGGGRMHQVARRFVAARHGLAAVERLGADLAHMVDSHQRPGFAAFGITQLQFGDGRCRVGAAGAGLGPQGAQGTVGSQNQGIHHAQSVNRRAKPWANMLL